MAIGASRLPTWLFAPLNIVAAIMWGCLVTGAGYLLGPAFERAQARCGAGIAVATVCLSVVALAFAAVIASAATQSIVRSWIASLRSQ